MKDLQKKSIKYFTIVKFLLADSVKEILNELEHHGYSAEDVAQAVKEKSLTTCRQPIT